MRICYLLTEKSDNYRSSVTLLIEKHWKTFDTLAIYVPEFEYILALKLFSGRPQDDRDILALAQRLALNTRAQAWSIVNSYIPDTQFRLRSEDTTQAIDRCFPN